MMRARQIVATSGLIAVVVWTAGPLGAQEKPAAPAKAPAAKPAASNAAQVARGKYLVTMHVCNDCHTPAKMGDNGPEPDMTKFLSGYPADMKLPPPPPPVGPW